MTKDFATFDCDAHVAERPLIWEGTHEFLTRDELDALKRTIWWDPEARLSIVNGRTGVGLGSPRRGGIPGTMRVISNAGPGVKHDIQCALNVRNLNPKAALNQGQAGKGTAPVGYNVQIAVDAEHHLIVAREEINQGYDRHQLAPMALRAPQATGCEQITALADRGYFSGDQVLLCEGTGVGPIVPALD